MSGTAARSEIAEPTTPFLLVDVVLHAVHFRDNFSNWLCIVTVTNGF